LKYEQVYLRAIPKASQYEKSFMHRDTITHVLATEFNLFKKIYNIFLEKIL